MKLVNKLFDPRDYNKPEYRTLKTYFEAWWNILQMEGIKFTYSSLNRAWEYGQIINNIDFRGKKVLDLGTSISLLPIFLVRMMECAVVTFDQAFHYERLELYEKTGCMGRENSLEVVDGDLMMPLPFKDGEFDIVTCFSTIEHLQDRAVAVSEMKRVCKDGGFIALTTDVAEKKPEVGKSGVTFTVEQILGLVREFGLPVYGETDYKNVNLQRKENQAVGEYTFASLVLQKI